MKTINGQQIIGAGDISVGGGASSVTSVNTKTGAVVLNTDDLSDATRTNKFVTQAQKNKVDALSGTNTGDETTGSIQSKRPLKTVNSSSLDGAGNLLIDKTSVGLSNVDNTSDANKPISTAVSTALSNKQATLVSGTNIKTVNGTTILGSGDLVVSASAAGTDRQVQFNNGGALAGADKVDIDTDGNITIDTYAVGTIPTIPSAGKVKIFGRNKGGKSLLAMIGPSGIDSAVQPFLGGNKVGVWSHSGNSALITAPTLFLMNMAGVAGNHEGTATARNITFGTGVLGSMKRLGFVTTAAVNLSVGTREIIAQYARGDASNKACFHFTTRFGYNTADTGNRGFVGFSSNVGAFTITAEPSATGTASTAICCGIGFDSTDTTWQIFIRSATGIAVTKVNTGLAKPVAGKSYEVCIFAPPNGTTVSFSIEDLDTGQNFPHTTSTNVPPINQALSHRLWGNTGTSATILGLDVSAKYIDTDF